MKNFKLLLLLVASMFVFQACNDDETANEGDIEGVWNVDSFSVELTIDGQNLSEFFSAAEASLYEELFTSSFEEEFEGSTIEFNSDGTFTSTDSDGDTESGSWSLNSDGTVVTITGTGTGEISYDVVTSTNDALVLSTSETENTDVTGDGNPNEVTTSIQLNLSK